MAMAPQAVMLPTLLTQTRQPMVTELSTAPVQPKDAAMLRKHHGPFTVGQHVMVKSFGDAVVVPCAHSRYMDAGRVEVKYADGSSYHCYPSRLYDVVENKPPQTKTVVLRAPIQGEPVQLGDRVMVKGYGLATVVALPADGEFAGRVKVRYSDATTYHCMPDQLTKVPLDTITLTKRMHPYRLGDAVHVFEYGNAVVVGLPLDGKFAGRIQVRYEDGSTYHCQRYELEPLVRPAMCECGRAFKLAEDNFCSTCGQKRPDA
eukprot:TRINITY_DN28633_c0_g1_i1.p1 TRINITY_DN28633_c0_g1~~TRINITY_DN28633_c0_g1_i1.p1  ORF type:complete len:260 (-),score=40.22 TRINITY_DN28633_c0_g1_i1:333-1112(-)